MRTPRPEPRSGPVESLQWEARTKPTSRHQAPGPRRRDQSDKELILSSTLIMRRFRKSKSPATPEPQGELAQKLKSLPQGNPMALAASSSAIALSIASPFYDTRDAPSDGDTVKGKDTGWQTAYNTAKMTVEITKESSDMFLPLKAVAGAMYILIKNYDVGVSCRGAEHLLILYLFSVPANLE